MNCAENERNNLLKKIPAFWDSNKNKLYLCSYFLNIFKVYFNYMNKINNKKHK